MSMKLRLKVLLSEAIENWFNEKASNKSGYEEVAEYLIDHGVTIVDREASVPVYTEEELVKQFKTGSGECSDK